MTVFLRMYHPSIAYTITHPVQVSPQSVDDHAAQGWLLVDPDAVLPEPSTPYYTKEALLSQIQGGASPIGTALRAALGAGSTDWLKSVAAAFGFAFTSLTTVDAATGLPTAAAVKWPDGTTGTFTGTTDGSNGYTGYAVTFGSGGSAKTVTASGITYDAATGLPLGPTALAVA